VVWAGAWEDRKHRGANSNTNRMPPRHFSSRRLLLTSYAAPQYTVTGLRSNRAHRPAMHPRMSFETPYPLFWDMR
jgi:hypothetical protein